MIRQGGSSWLLGAGGLALAAIPSAVAASSTTVDGPLAVIYAAVGVLLVWMVGLLLWQRPQERRVALMLFALAVAYALRTLAASDSAWVYSLARAFGPVAEFLLVWIMLAFPSGRLRSVPDRVIVTGAAVTATLLWLPVVLFSRDVPLSGVLVPCGTNCPTNTLVLSDSPHLAATFLAAFRWSGTLLLLAVALSLLDRLLRASRLSRRTLAPVLVVSILRVLGVATFVAAGTLLPGFVLPVLFWLVPLSMALGLLLGRLYSAAALQRLVTGLQLRPHPQQLRAVMANVLGDPRLAISYWLSDHECWIDEAGVLSSEPPEPGAGQAISIAELPDGSPVAALVHDAALLEQPQLLDAVKASTGLALEGSRLQLELERSDARAMDARDRARREFERDLHDGAQQRLIALRIKVSILNRMLEQDAGQAAELARQLGPDIDATVAEVRALGHGRGPGLLNDAGLRAALGETFTQLDLPVTLDAEGVGRYRSDIECAVFFTCMEAAQNAVKHAGLKATAVVRLRDSGDALTFEITDTGPGGASLNGDVHGGLSNVRQRIKEVRGTVTVTSTTGSGTSLCGQIPLN
jgi:signal transduction histidine kinase